MSPTIRILDSALSNQIAAGEVVERPGSVVKELLENALDAGASRVTVELEDGGKRRIRVVDDGHGMDADGALLCLKRHATSKLRSLEDLFAIGTLGFRGEALPSIASVSRLTLTTRTADSAEGTRVRVEGGAPPEVAAIGCASGCTVDVQDLFYNVPARLKFLRAKATESGHVATVCLQTALAHPELQLTLLRDGRVAREFLRAQDFHERVRAAFPAETLTAIDAEMECEGGQIRIEASLAAPERARSGATGLHLLVNGRPVRDTSLARAVAFAYGSVMPPGRFPLGALHLHLPAADVDVNVHPQKREVRFRQGKQTFDAVTRLLAKQLGTSAWGRSPAHPPRSYWDTRLGQALPDLPTRTGLSDAGPAVTPSPALGAQDVAPALGPSVTGHETGGADPWGLTASNLPGPQADHTRADPAPTRDQPPVEAAGAGAVHAGGQVPLSQPAGFFAGLRVLGQVRRMLIICEGQDALYVIDQHAADERLRYHRLRTSYQSGDVATQQLLFPERVQCSDSEVAAVEAHREALLSLGLDCTLLGPTTVAIHTVPALLRRAPPERLLRDVLTELSRTGERAFGDAVDMALATMACHAAIRAGDPLAPEEATALLVALDEVPDFGGHCPHGRPVLSRIPLDDLERRLGR